MVSTGLAPRLTARRKLPGIGDPERHGAGTGAVLLGEPPGKAVGFGIHDEVDLTLAVERHVP